MNIEKVKQVIIRIERGDKNNQNIGTPLIFLALATMMLYITFIFFFAIKFVVSGNVSYWMMIKATFSAGLLMFIYLYPVYCLGGE